jgi:Transposase IS116/IS110/IS902 family
MAARCGWAITTPKSNSRSDPAPFNGAENACRRRRYASAKSRKDYAGTSPITRASGTKRVVLARHVRNQHLADAIYLWTFAAIAASPGARHYYDLRQAAG